MDKLKKLPPPWSSEDVSILVRMAAEGYMREQIAQCFPNRTRAAVDHKLAKLGIRTFRHAYKETDPVKCQSVLYRKVKWPPGVRFEDVTREEAMAIASGAPRSLQVPSRTWGSPYSLIGNSSSMCAA